MSAQQFLKISLFLNVVDIYSKSSCLSQSYLWTVGSGRLGHLMLFKSVQELTVFREHCLVWRPKSVYRWSNLSQVSTVFNDPYVSVEHVDCSTEACELKTVRLSMAGSLTRCQLQCTHGTLKAPNNFLAQAPHHYSARLTSLILLIPSMMRWDRWQRGRPESKPCAPTLP